MSSKSLYLYPLSLLPLRVNGIWDNRVGNWVNADNEEITLPTTGKWANPNTNMPTGLPGSGKLVGKSLIINLEARDLRGTISASSSRQYLCTSCGPEPVATEDPPNDECQAGATLHGSICVL